MRCVTHTIISIYSNAQNKSSDKKPSKSPENSKQNGRVEKESLATHRPGAGGDTAISNGAQKPEAQKINGDAQSNGDCRERRRNSSGA